MRHKVTPIPTRYKGYRFRSRLEARWAVFFDELGIPYEYEPEGYDLGEYGYYLPDFWLPKQQKWVEVKPEDQIWFAEEQMLALCDTYHRWTGTIMSSIPYLENEDVSPFDALLYTRLYAQGGFAEPYWWCQCYGCEAIGYEYEGDASDILGTCRGCGAHFGDASSPLIVDAYNAARGARFEHGDAA